MFLTLASRDGRPVLFRSALHLKLMLEPRRAPQKSFRHAHWLFSDRLVPSLTTICSEKLCPRRFAEHPISLWGATCCAFSGRRSKMMARCRFNPPAIFLSRPPPPRPSRDRDCWHEIKGCGSLVRAFKYRQARTEAAVAATCAYALRGETRASTIPSAEGVRSSCARRGVISAYHAARST
jgi:hypothetical protein